MRRGGEWRGLGEQGKRGAEGKWSSAGAAGASQRGPGRSRLPSQLGSGHASPAPSRQPALRPRAARGKHPPAGTFGTRCLRCQHVPRTPAATPTPSRPRRPPLPPAGPGRDRGVRTSHSAAPLSRAWQPCARVSQGALTGPAIPPQLGLPGQAISAQRGDGPRFGPGTRDRRHPLPEFEAPQSTHKPAGLPGEGVRRSLASGGRRREEEEESGTEGDPETGRGGGGKERRRRERGSRGGGTETETWGPSGGRRPLCLRTIGRGKGARGGARGAGPRSRDPAWTRLATPLFPPQPLALDFRPHGPHPAPSR